LKFVKFWIKKMAQGCEFILFIIYYYLPSISIISSSLCAMRYSNAIPNDCNLFILIMSVTNLLAIIGNYMVLKSIDKLKSSVWLKAVYCFISIVWFAVLVLTIVEMKIIIKDINLIDSVLFYSAVINMISTFSSMILNFIYLIKYM